jgi:predicted nucleic acid-binding protein
MGNDDTTPRPRSGKPVSSEVADADAVTTSSPSARVDRGRLGNGSGERKVADDDEDAIRRVARDFGDRPDASRDARPSWAHVLAALAPRPAPVPCAAERCESLLEGYRGYVVSATVVAIARAWDSGRIVLPSANEPPFASEVFGIAGRRTGLAVPHLAEAMTALEEAIVTLEAARAALGEPGPLEILCTEHGVSKLGGLLLLFVAAPGLWGEVARVYGILGNDPARRTCDEHLLWQLFGGAMRRRDIARELGADSPLVSHGLVRVVGDRRPFQSLEADPIVVKLLAGLPVDADVEPGVAPVRSSVALDRFVCPAGVIERALGELAAAPPGLGRVVVRGRSGSGRRTLLAALAQLAGRSLATIDAAVLIRENRLGALVGMLQRAHLCGWLPCVDGLDTIRSEDAVTRGAVRALLRGHQGPLAVRVARHAEPPLEPGYVMIELPDQGIAERAAQWSEVCGEAGLVVGKVDELAARFSVGPGTIRKVVSAAARRGPRDANPAIEAALRQHLETRLGAVATRVTRLASWSQIVLPAVIQDSVAELIGRVRHRRTVYDTWGFDQITPTSRGLVALFQGGPGTGKTLLAGALANELGLDLYRVDLAQVLSKWIGETEQNLARVFDAAEEGQAMVLFDEADSLFSQRTEVRTSLDRHANHEINYLLQRLDSFEGVAVLTTNHGTAIDAAFKRRLTCCLTLPFPDAEARERLWRVHVPERLPVTGFLDFADLARRYEMSGGYIRNAVLRAAFLAAQEQTQVSQFHLERAIRAEFRDAGKRAASEALE